MELPFLLIFELIGTVAFSISGAAIGLRKNMDIFGVVILGLCTAVGGGVLRDLILGITPPGTFRAPIYAIVAIGTAIIAFLPAVRRLFGSHQRLSDLLLLVMDSVGLGIFTVVGVRVAYDVPCEHGLYLMCFVGVITGVGGGILRDCMAGLMPYVFVKHFYACASLIGSIACTLLWSLLGETGAMIVGTVLVIVLRLLAARYRWSLPKAHPVSK